MSEGGSKTLGRRRYDGSKGKSYIRVFVPRAERSASVLGMWLEQRAEEEGRAKPP